MRIAAALGATVALMPSTSPVQAPEDGEPVTLDSLLSGFDR